jgi:hypothetical protein
LLAVYLLVQSTVVLATGFRPHHSTLGIAWTAITAAVMFTEFCRGSPGLQPREESAPEPGGAQRRRSLRCLQGHQHTELCRVP